VKFVNKQSGVSCLNKGWKFLEITNREISKMSEKEHNDIYDATKGGNEKGPMSGVYDDGSWEDVTLPHDWVTRKDFDSSESSSGGYKERGVAWYRVNFEISEDDRRKQILLEFEGMSAEATIYVNGYVMERSFSGYTPFSIDITDIANFGMTPNTLAVHIDARGAEGWWYEGAGIYRNVWLTAKPPVHIGYDGIFVRPVFVDDKWQVEVDAEVENSFDEKQSFTIKTEVIDASNHTVAVYLESSEVGAFDKETITYAFEIKEPILWDIENPYLYQARTTVSVGNAEDYIITPLGFRTISVCSDTGFYLNGKHIKLLGFCNHQDHAGVGVAVPYAIKEYRVKLLKEIGANAYRCAHNTDPEILDICDKLGMLVMEENRTFSPSRDAVRNIELMVRHSRNHPSVVMYSIFNEEPTAGSFEGYMITSRLKSAILRNDNTRLITCAMNSGYMESVGATAAVDVVGINYHPLAYAPFHEKFPDKPLVGAETTSSFSVRGEWKSDYDRNTISGFDEDCAPWSNHVRTAWKYVTTQDFVMGTFVWTGFDYRGEPTPFPWPSVSSFFGTFDACGFRKDPVYLYEALWKNEPIVHIVPHWNLPLCEFDDVRVRVYSNCEHIKLSLNGKVVGESDNDLLEQTLFSFPYQPGEVRATGYIDNKEVASSVVRTTKEAVRLKITLSKPIMQNDGHDAVAVNVEALDSGGLFVPTAGQLVNFNLSGGADIIGVGNGNQNSHEPDYADFRHLFNGRCQAIIKSNGDPQDVRVTVSSTGLESDTIEIKVNESANLPAVKIINTRVITGWRICRDLFDEMPDPNMQIESSDNNSFEPIVFDYKPQAILDKMYSKYAIYRVVCDFGKSEDVRLLCFNRIYGEVWLYIDGELILYEDYRHGGLLEYTIPDTLTGKHTMAIILRHMHESWDHSGIYDPVVIKM